MVSGQDYIAWFTDAGAPAIRRSSRRRRAGLNSFSTHHLGAAFDLAALSRLLRPRQYARAARRPAEAVRTRALEQLLDFCAQRGIVADEETMPT